MQCVVQFVQTTAGMARASETVVVVCAVVTLNVLEAVAVPHVTTASSVVTFVMKDSVVRLAHRDYTRFAL